MMGPGEAEFMRAFPADETRLAHRTTSSGGRSTVGDREVLDLAAAVAWARGFGHPRLVTVGFSMGGSVVLRHAALHGADAVAGTDAVVSVSSPARWYYRGTAPMRRLHWLVMRPAGRLVGRWGLRTRIHHRDWDPVPLSPVEAAARITVPLLRPTLALSTIMCVTGSLLAFEQFYILTKGGPDNSTITVVQLIYTVAFQGKNDLGIAAALSVIVLLALVAINVLQLRAFRTSDES